MKKIVSGLRIGVCICAVMGWWGVLYPELCMTPDTYQIVWEDGTVQNVSEVVELGSESDIYYKILASDRSQIRFRSKLLETAADLLGNR